MRMRCSVSDTGTPDEPITPAEDAHAKWDAAPVVCNEENAECAATNCQQLVLGRKYRNTVLLYLPVHVCSSKACQSQNAHHVASSARSHQFCHHVHRYPIVPQQSTRDKEGCRQAYKY